MRNHQPQRAAVFALDVGAVAAHGQQHVVTVQVGQRDVRRIAVARSRRHGPPPSRECASGRGRARARISRTGTPSQRLSKVLQRVTQWKSVTTSRRGSAVIAAQVSASGVSTRPFTLKSQVAGSKTGLGPHVQDGPLDRRRLAGRQAALGAHPLLQQLARVLALQVVGQHGCAGRNPAILRCAGRRRCAPAVHDHLRVDVPSIALGHGRILGRGRRGGPSGCKMGRAGRAGRDRADPDDRARGIAGITRVMAWATIALR